MDIGLNWNEWHQEAARKPYVRVGVTLLSGALILMSAQEIVSLYLEKNLISEIEVCATTEDINVSGNDLPEKVTITKQIKNRKKWISILSYQQKLSRQMLIKQMLSR
jgi:hypothetical protein